MSIFTVEKSTWHKTDRFGSGYRTFHYEPVSKEYYDKIHEENDKLQKKWIDILNNGFISASDISFATGYCRRYIESVLNQSGYYWFINRDIYKSGAKFWHFSDVEHCFPEIRNCVQKLVNDEFNPFCVSFNGKLLYVYFQYFGIKFYVEEVRLEKKKHDREMKKLEEAMEIDVDTLMERIFDEARKRGGNIASMLDEFNANGEIPRIGFRRDEE